MWPTLPEPLLSFLPAGAKGRALATGWGPRTSHSPPHGLRFLIHQTGCLIPPQPRSELWGEIRKDIWGNWVLVVTSKEQRIWG